MSNQKKGLEQFLRQQLFRERSIPLEKFVLRHAKVGARGMEIEEFPVTGQIDQGQIPYMVDDVLQRAQSYADGLGNKLQGFSLEAVVEGAKTGSKFTFRLRGESDEGDDEDGEEAPNERGLTSQLMRHNEALMRMVVMTTGSAVHHLQEQLKHSGKIIAEMSAREYEQRKLVEASASEQHDRDMQMLITSGAEDRKSAMFKKIEMLIPIVLRKFAGAPSMTAEEASLVGPLVASLTEEQIRNIASQLSPEQQMAFFTLYKDAKQKATAASQKQENGVS